MLDLLLEVRSALSAGEIEERTKHSAAEGSPLADALRASAKVDALPDGRFRYKVPAWALNARRQRSQPDQICIMLGTYCDQ